MAIKKTYNMVTYPPQWSSVHQPIKFTYDMPTEIATFVYQSDGFLALGFTSGHFMNNMDLVQVGDLLYVTTGTYTGYHVVKSIIARTAMTLSVRTNTEVPLSLISTSSEVKYATPPIWSVWKGFISGEVVYSNPFTYEKVSEFQPEGNPDGYLEFDVSGYMQSAMFPMIPPQEGTLVTGSTTLYSYYDYNLYMPFRILTPTYFETRFYALNSGIDTTLLNSEYVDTPKYLLDYGIQFSCGETIVSKIANRRIRTFRGVGEVVVPVTGFDSGFSSGFFKT